MSDYEQNIAMMEAERHYIEEQYFAARPNLDTDANRNMFRAAFERGWNAKRAVAQPPKEATP